MTATIEILRKSGKTWLVGFIDRDKTKNIVSRVGWIRENLKHDWYKR